MSTEARSMLAVVVVAVASIAFASCGPGGGKTDAGVNGDGGSVDSGTPDAGCTCAMGVCLGDGGCGECALDRDCPSGKPACDPSRNTCVVCRAAPDSCDAGTYCLNEACVPGCGRDSDCSSGVCLGTHDCLNCRGDGECAGGRLCGTGACIAPCTTTCANGRSCCGGRCVDVTRDPAFCGNCTTACAADAFCGTSMCRAPLLSNTCTLPSATVLLDGIDDSAGVSMATALVSACTPAVNVRTVGQLDAGVLNPVTGEPLVPGELFCAAGGSFRQRAIAWLEQNGLAPVRDTSTTSIYRYSLRDGGIVAAGPVGDLNALHDIFVIQIVRAPSGATVLNAGGYYTEGTAAGAWYFVNRLLPMRASLTNGWYVVEWRDTMLNGLPDPGDTWTPIAQGL